MLLCLDTFMEEVREESDESLEAQYEISNFIEYFSSDDAEREVMLDYLKSQEEFSL